MITKLFNVIKLAKEVRNLTDLGASSCTLNALSEDVLRQLARLNVDAFEDFIEVLEEDIKDFVDEDFED